MYTTMSLSCVPHYVFCFEWHNSVLYFQPLTIQMVRNPFLCICSITLQFIVLHVVAVRWWDTRALWCFADRWIVFVLSILNCLSSLSSIYHSDVLSKLFLNTQLRLQIMWYRFMIHEIRPAEASIQDIHEVYFFTYREDELYWQIYWTHIYGAVGWPAACLSRDLKKS